MNLFGVGIADLVGAVVGLVITLCIFSYILGDNVLFRLAIHIFIGVAAGYAAVSSWYNIILPQLIQPLVSGNRSEMLFVIFPLFFAGLLLTKLSPRLSNLGKPTMAYLVGIGVATAIGGAVIGTVIPQVLAASNLLPAEASTGMGNGGGWLSILRALGNGLIAIIGTVTTLVYFQFGVSFKAGQPAERPRWMEILATIGQVFIAVTLGTLFAGVYSAALAAMVERWYFILKLLLPQ